MEREQYLEETLKESMKIWEQKGPRAAMFFLYIATQIVPQRPTNADMNWALKEIGLAWT